MWARHVVHQVKMQSATVIGWIVHSSAKTCSVVLSHTFEMHLLMRSLYIVPQEQVNDSYAIYFFPLYCALMAWIWVTENERIRQILFSRCAQLRFSNSSRLLHYEEVLAFCAFICHHFSHPHFSFTLLSCRRSGCVRWTLPVSLTHWSGVLFTTYKQESQSFFRCISPNQVGSLSSWFWCSDVAFYTFALCSQ